MRILKKNNRRFLIWAFVVLFVMGSAWFLCRESKDQATLTFIQMGSSGSESAAVLAQPEASENLAATETETERLPAAAVDPHSSLQKVRLNLKEQGLRKPQNQLIKNPHLRGQIDPSILAIANRNYKSSMGPLLGKVGGYSLVAAEGRVDALADFDGKTLPVVLEPGRAQYGVVTGEVVVKFKNKIEDMDGFAKTFNLKLITSLPRIKKAIFYPESLPANLQQIAEAIAQEPYIEFVEFSVIRGRRQPN